MTINHLQGALQAKDTADIYTDLNGLKNLKATARKDARTALPEVARQFEAVMISMMIKNLRKTGMEDPIFKSEAMDSYRDMHDQQLSMELSKGRGIGLAESIIRQLEHQTGQVDVSPGHSHNLKIPERREFPDHYISVDRNVEKESPVLIDNKLVQADTESAFQSPEHFVQKLWPLAEQTAKKLGVSPEVILSQAALETGWGKFVISKGDQSSFNLFNIKAGRDWSGKRMEKVSMEYIQGRALQQKSDFRAYNSFEQSFADYTDFIQNNPRYDVKSEQSLHDETYIKQLHNAGYATDPNYSEKVLRVMGSDAIQNMTKVALK